MDDFRIELTSGEIVFDLISKSGFRAKWQDLVAETSHSTLNLTPSFVSTWYRTYRSRFRPLLCVAYGTQDDIVGLIPLAVCHHTNRLTHAGDHHAEYRGWLARASVESTFLISILISLKDAYSLSSWAWGRLPPGAATNWLKCNELRQAGIHVHLKHESSPVFDILEKNIIRVTRNKSLRNKLNRLRRIGEVKLERIIDPTRAAQLVPTVTSQCDFRQLVANNLAPFSMDRLKTEYYLARTHHLETNHFSVLWLNQEPLAYHFGVCNAVEVYLGLSGFNPIWGRYSPGSLLFLELFKLLHIEGITKFDLTPGGDNYKERFASSHVDIVSPTFYFSVPHKFRDNVIRSTRNCAKSVIRAANLSPDQCRSHARSVMHYARDLRSMVGRLTFRKLAGLVVRPFWDRRVYCYYHLTAERFAGLRGRIQDPRPQRYEELLQLAPYSEAPQALLAEAMERWSRGEILYTQCKDDVPAHYGWVVAGGKTHRFSEVDMTFDSPPNTVVLYDFFTAPDFRGLGLYQQNLIAILGDCFAQGAKAAYIGAARSNIASRKVIERVGFEPCTTYIAERVLWYVQKQEISHVEVV